VRCASSVVYAFALLLTACAVNATAAEGQYRYDPSGPVAFLGTPGAHIELEGLDTGYAVPANFTFAPGVYGYRVWLEGYQEQRGTVTFTGEPTAILAELQPLVGNLNVTVRPRQAEVRVDGVVAGRGDMLIANLPAGVHRVTVAADGYRAREYEVNLAAGTTLRLDVALEGLPGTVVVAAPSSARVYFDDAAVGVGTVRIPDVQPGVHAVALEAAGHHPYHRLVAVAPGANVSLSVDELLPLPAFSPEFLAYTWDNFLRGLGEILQAVLNSFGL